MYMELNWYLYLVQEVIKVNCDKEVFVISRTIVKSTKMFKWKTNRRYNNNWLIKKKGIQRTDGMDRKPIIGKCS